jgi:hypothetical protein
MVGDAARDLAAGVGGNIAFVGVVDDTRRPGGSAQGVEQQVGLACQQKVQQDDGVDDAARQR